MSHIAMIIQIIHEYATLTKYFCSLKGKIDFENLLVLEKNA